MPITALLLSRIQFATTTSFHILFPAFTTGLAAWLSILEAVSLATGNCLYRTLFDFWLKIFAMTFGMCVVSGIVMALQFRTNWSELSRASGAIQGPLLTYESFTAFALEASFFGVILFGRKLVSPWFYLLSCILVAVGTTLSAFWILVNNSWMQHPVGYILRNGLYVPTDWPAIIFNSVVWPRFPHMLVGAYLTTAFCIAAVGARFLLLLTLAISYLPLIVPDTLTLAEVAAPPSSQSFMFWGAGLFVTPFIVVYTYISHSVFTGKLRHLEAYT